MPNDEWQTPPEIIEMAREAMGSIDFDPASNADANRLVVKAALYYTKEHNGLEKFWPNWNTWLNPPYSQPLCANFIERLVIHANGWRCIKSPASATLLVNNSSDTRWYHLALSTCAAYCVPRGRMAFWINGKPCNQNRQGQTLFYFGPEMWKWCEMYESIGKVIPLKFCW